jgi:hypothetical protein
MNNPDFTYTGTLSASPSVRTPQSEENERAYTAASLSYKIRSTEPDPAKWKPLIEDCPEDVRALVREYLAQAWRSMKRARLGKQCEAGDKAIGELKQRFGAKP